MQRVYLKNTEVTEYIYSVPTLQQSIASYGEVMQIGDITLDGDVDFWNYNNKLSPMYNVDYKYMAIKVIEDTTNTIVYKGLIKDIILLSDTITIQVTNNFDKIMNTFLPYHFTNQNTPANIIKDLLMLYNIDYKSSDFTYADTIQNSAGLQVTAQVTQDSNTTVGSLITELCKASISSLGFINNEARYYQYDSSSTPDTTVTIEDDHIFEITINSSSKPIYNGYIVTWSSSTSYIIGDVMSSQIDLGQGRIVTLWNPSGAVWIGTNWNNYYNGIIKTGNIELINELQFIKLGSIIELDTTDYGTDKYRVIGLNTSDISITCELESV